jgi:hypothetical protein
MVILLALLVSPITEHWMSSPYDRFGPIAIALWLLTPSGHFALAGTFSTQLAFAAAAVGLLGLGSDLNVCFHVAFAFAVASFMTGRAFVCLWLVCAVGWMPVLGYGLSQLSVSADVTHAVRVVLALTPLLLNTNLQRSFAKRVRPLGPVLPPELGCGQPLSCLQSVPVLTPLRQNRVLPSGLPSANVWVWLRGNRPAVLHC